MEVGRRRRVQQRQHLEEVALEGQITHDEGPGQTQLAGRPEQPPNGVRGSHLECVRRRVGPREVPSQNSNRTGGGPPKKWARRGATAAATPPPESGSAAAGWCCLGRNGRGLEMRSDFMSVSR